MKFVTKADLGQKGEALAAKFLISNRYRILERNFNTRWGEIDLICFFDNIVIFVEVKLRSSSLDNALSSVSRSKQKKMVKTAQEYLFLHPELQDYPIRFDIITILQKEKQYQLKHFKDAFLPRADW